MVAMVFLSIALLGLVSVQIYSLRATGGNRQRHVASIIASSVMNEKEEALRKNFSDPVGQARMEVPGQEGYHYEVTEELCAPSLKKVTVTVSWKERERTVEYSVWTYIFDFKSIS